MPNGHGLSQLTQLLRGEIPARPDWDRLMHLAGSELVVPQLLGRLEAVRERLPEEVLSYLAETRRRSILRNARLRETLSDALRALNAIGLEPVLLKGAALWATEAGPGERLIRDIDLFVRPEDMQAAVDCLTQAGFAILADERETCVHDVVVLGRESDAGSIDLHQHAPALQSRSGVDDLFLHTRRVRLPDGHARVLTPEAQLFVMAIHDQIHDAKFWRGGYNLRHLLDIAVISRSGVDWDGLERMCRSRTEHIALGALLHAARTIAQADVPARMLKAWPRLHFYRQHAQFDWPWLTTIMDGVRAARAAFTASAR